jgi:hypothetical protein
LLAHHDRIDARWLDYEMDVARLLDFPMMTDMRQPLTVAFHKARSHAGLLRPMRSGGGAATSRPKGSSGWNAQHLLRVASDDAATPHERQSAYAKARHELDGLMVLPAITRAGIERRIAGEIEA